MPTEIKPGIYNTEYFSGAQCAVYIGDVWVDEITSLSFQYQQARAPLYGYADTLFRDMAKGKVLVQGSFTLNFKEAGYLFLILDRYRQMMKGLPSVMGATARDQVTKIDGMRKVDPFVNSGLTTREAIETVINNDGRITKFERNEILNGLAEYQAKGRYGISASKAWTSLTGFPTQERADTASTRSENIFEAFEDAIWKKSQDQLDDLARRADDPRFGPFDIYVTFGDFAADNSVNHTVKKISDVYIVGGSTQVVIDGQPIQEAYQFMARNVV